MELITWLALVLASLLIGYWFVTVFFVAKEPLEKMENDLKNIRAMVDDACQTKYYKASYNPFTEEGTLDLNKTDLCITRASLSRCRNFLCEEFAEAQATISLSKTTNIIVEKKDGKVVVYAE